MRVALYEEVVVFPDLYQEAFSPTSIFFLGAWKAQRRTRGRYRPRGHSVTCLVWQRPCPQREVKNVWGLFAAKLTAGTAGMIGSGFLLYVRGRARA